MPEPSASPAGAGTPSYGWRALSGDLAGGAVAALIALPYGLAMARLMGLPPALGLFTSVATAPVTAMLGRNPVLIGGTASATVPFVAAAVHAQGPAGAAKVVLAAAGFTLAFASLRLGRHVARIPHAVVSGFSCGVGGMMIVMQLGTLLGLPAGSPSAGPEPLAQLAWAVRHLGQARPAPLFLGAIVVAGATLSARRWPRSPAMLSGVGLAALAVWGLGLHEASVGVIPLEWPSPADVHWRPADAFDILPAALGLAFVASLNVLITARVVDHFRGRHHPPGRSDADGELTAYGLANLVAGAFGAPPTVGIPARSLANVRCGGTTRLSNLFHALALLALIRLGTGLIGRVPLAALAGVTAWVGLGLLEWSTWRRLPRMRRLDAAAFLGTAFAVLAANAAAAVAFGCALYAAHHLAARALGPSRARRLNPAEGEG